jgi:NADH:ubiquinone oxidoreductase subunit D
MRLSSKSASEYKRYLLKLEEMYKAGRIEEEVYKTLREEYEIEFARRILSEEFASDASTKEVVTSARARAHGKTKCSVCGSELEYDYHPPFRCVRCGNLLR